TCQEPQYLWLSPSHKPISLRSCRCLVVLGSAVPVSHRTLQSHFPSLLPKPRSLPSPSLPSLPSLAVTEFSLLPSTLPNPTQANSLTLGLDLSTNQLPSLPPFIG